MWNCIAIVHSNCDYRIFATLIDLLMDLLSATKGQQLQVKQTSDATSLLRLCCRASVSHTRKGTLDVASRAPGDERSSCRCRPFVTSYFRRAVRPSAGCTKTRQSSRLSHGLKGPAAVEDTSCRPEPSDKERNIRKPKQGRCEPHPPANNEERKKSLTQEETASIPKKRMPTQYLSQFL